MGAVYGVLKPIRFDRLIRFQERTLWLGLVARPQSYANKQTNFTSEDHNSLVNAYEEVLKALTSTM